MIRAGRERGRPGRKLMSAGGRRRRLAVALGGDVREGVVQSTGQGRRIHHGVRKQQRQRRQRRLELVEELRHRVALRRRKPRAPARRFGVGEGLAQPLETGTEPLGAQHTELDPVGKPGYCGPRQAQRRRPVAQQRHQIDRAELVDHKRQEQPRQPARRRMEERRPRRIVDVHAEAFEFRRDAARQVLVR